MSALTNGQTGYGQNTGVATQNTTTHNDKRHYHTQEG